MSVTNIASHRAQDPSPWVVNYSHLVPIGGLVLDLACGAGRHGRFFREQGHPVVMLDRDISSITDMASDEMVEIIATDLEDGRPWPLAGRLFDAIVVANYLYRPILPNIISSIAPGGALLYETFSAGNEKFGRPSNPDFLLTHEELLIATRPELRAVAFEEREVTSPRPAAIQHIAAVKDA